MKKKTRNLITTPVVKIPKPMKWQILLNLISVEYDTKYAFDFQTPPETYWKMFWNFFTKYCEPLKT